MKKLVLFLSEIIMIMILLCGMIYSFSVPFQILFEIIDTSAIGGSILLVSSWILAYVLFKLLDHIRVQYADGIGIFKKLREYRNY